MEQLILHLLGDYILQTDKMAKEKTSDMGMAILHGFVYSLPFLFVFDLVINSWLVIWFTHALIDRYRVARYIVFAKNWIHNPNLEWSDCSKTGYPSSTPDWMAVWLTIIADNTLHLAINYAVITWL